MTVIKTFHLLYHYCIINNKTANSKLDSPKITARKIHNTSSAVTNMPSKTINCFAQGSRRIRKLPRTTLSQLSRLSSLKTSTINEKEYLQSNIFNRKSILQLIRLHETYLSDTRVEHQDNLQVGTNQPNELQQILNILNCTKLMENLLQSF